MSDDSAPRRPATLLRKFALALWFASWPLLALLHLYPIRDTPLRYLIAGVFLLLWAGALGLFRQRRATLWLCGAVLLCVAATLLVSGRDASATEMRALYTQALCFYAGTPYVWGGETPHSIDCSGLLRRALMDANLRQALRSGNPRPLRRALALWWQDCSAKALGDEYRGWTRRLFTTPNLNRLDYSRLQPGDVAVTTGGNHCMAYLARKPGSKPTPVRWSVIK